MTSPTTNREDREAAAIGPRILKDPRSVAYAWQTVSLLKGVYGRREVSLRDWAAALAVAERHEIFNRIPPEKPYGSMDAMLKAEIGVTLEESVQNVWSRLEEPTPLERMLGLLPKLSRQERGQLRLALDRLDGVQG